MILLLTNGMFRKEYWNDPRNKRQSNAEMEHQHRAAWQEYKLNLEQKERQAELKQQHFREMIFLDQRRYDLEKAEYTLSVEQFEQNVLAYDRAYDAYVSSFQKYVTESLEDYVLNPKSNQFVSKFTKHGGELFKAENNVRAFPKPKPKSKVALAKRLPIPTPKKSPALKKTTPTKKDAPAKLKRKASTPPEQEGYLYKKIFTSSTATEETEQQTINRMRVEHVFNSETGRWVKKTGKLGKKILEAMLKASKKK